MNQQKTIHKLYRKLLGLYPAGFRDRLGVSMEQTFNDKYNEIQNNGQNKFGFILWMFIENAMGIFREHLLLVSPGESMKTMLKTFGSSMLLSSLITLPFMIMEIVNRRNYNEEFPFALFIGI